MSASNVSSQETPSSDLGDLIRELSPRDLHVIREFRSSAQRELDSREQRVFRKTFELLAISPGAERIDAARSILEWISATLALEFLSREIVELFEALPPERRLYTIGVLLPRFAELLREAEIPQAR